MLSLEHQDDQGSFHRALRRHIEETIAAARPNTDCQKYFQRLGRPLGFSRSLCGSHRPSRWRQTAGSRPGRSRRSGCAGRPKARCYTAMDERISAPPMVGVPFFDRCDCGPSLRNRWTDLQICRVRIIHGQSHRDNASAVSTPECRAGSGIERLQSLVWNCCRYSPAAAALVNLPGCAPQATTTFSITALRDPLIQNGCVVCGSPALAAPGSARPGVAKCRRGPKASTAWAMFRPTA